MLIGCEPLIIHFSKIASANEAGFFFPSFIKFSGDMEFWKLPVIDDRKDYKYSLQFPKGDKVGGKKQRKC